MTRPALQHFTDPAEFTRVAEPFLLRLEATHCLQLGLLGAMSAGEWPDRFMAAAMQGPEPLLIALRTPPYALVLSHTESMEALELLVTGLQQGPAELLPGEVMGPAPVSDEFARLGPQGRLAGGRYRPGADLPAGPGSSRQRRQRPAAPRDGSGPGTPDRLVRRVPRRSPPGLAG
jgi:hypothetical protein